MLIPIALVIGVSSTLQDPAPPATATTLPPVEVVGRPDEGEVTLQCRVNPRGELSGCVILSETPAGRGFGEAALDAARRTRFQPRTVRGAGRDATIRFTTRFRGEQPSAP